MKTSLLAILCMMGGLGVSNTAAQTAIGLGEADDALIAAKWNNRLLVVCERANGAEDPIVFSAQYDQALFDWPGYIERKLILVWIDDSDITSWKPVPNSDKTKSATLLIGNHSDDPTSLRERAACKTVEDPKVLLIGLDGGVKNVWGETVSTVEVFANIDAMPMRALEINRQQSAD